MNKKILIIRFSSFGDIIQCMPVIDYLSDHFTVDFLVKKEFANLVELSTRVSNVIAFDKKDGLLGLMKLAVRLRADNYTHIYDAHNNVRSFLFLFIFRLFNFNIKNINFIQRSKDRLKRILLFNFRINKFPKPFKGIQSYILPVKNLKESNLDSTQCELNFSEEVTTKVQDLTKEHSSYIVFAPSAAWKMKRWPIDHWKSLASLLHAHKIIVLGGPSDTFCEEIAVVDSSRILNLSGKTSLIESACIVKNASFCISGDTGILHVADILNIKTIALIGPTAFGFPSSHSSKVCEVNLSCRPCTKDGRGKCTQDIYQKCMVDITPEAVSLMLSSFGAR